MLEDSSCLLGVSQIDQVDDLLGIFQVGLLFVNILLDEVGCFGEGLGQVFFC